MTDNITDKITIVFPEQRNRRFEVVFRELLGIAIKYASLHPDRDANDLIARARAIAASFPK